MTTALACLLAASAGIALGAVALPGSPGAGLAALVGAALAGGAALAVRPLVVPLVAAACLLGGPRAEGPGGDPPAAARAPAVAGQQVLVDGRVADDPRAHAGGLELLVAPDRLVTAAGPRRPAGAVVAFVKGAPDVAIGDRVRVAGRLDLPRDRPDFDRRAYV